MADAPLLEKHDGIACLSGRDLIVHLSGRDLTNFQFISVTKDSFVPVSLKPINNRLNIIM
jgi:hypothetical protein